MTPPANDPIYKSAKLAEDGTVTFDKKLYFVLDANVNFQLINAIAGGVAGGAEALLKGGAIQNILSGGSLESALKGALNSGIEQGKSADFRDVTAKVTGTFDKPAVSLVKVAPAKQEAAGETPAATQNPVVTPSSSPTPTQQQPKPEDVIKERIIDAIIPTKPEQPAQQQEAGKEEPKPQPIEKQIEKQIEDQVKKGLEDLFKKR